jgi:hypothetical protein
MAMLDLRTLGLGVGVFLATFLVGWWFNIGNLASAIGIPGVTRLTESPAPPMPSAQKPPPGKGLVGDQLTRDVVVSWSQSYQRPACNQDVRWGYVNAATKYAEALMRAAGCHNFPRCPMSMGQLERVWEANRSALDLPVAQAMAAAHAAGGLTERSFRGDVGRAVRVIAGRDFDPGPAPTCSTRNKRTWSFRVRRR